MTTASLVLASRSARRAQLLREAGYTFKQVDPPFDDPPQPESFSGKCALDLVVDLATRKCTSLSDQDNTKQLNPESVILGADTLCLGPAGQWLGQPATRQQARQMIVQFVGSTHEVVTGVALVRSDQGRTESFVDVASVRFGHLDERRISVYLDSGQWQGKAGAYNLFDRQADGWAIDVTGDPTTVVGLPMRRLVPRLQRWGVGPLSSLGRFRR